MGFVGFGRPFDDICREILMAKPRYLDRKNGLGFWSINSAKLILLCASNPSFREMRSH